MKTIKRSIALVLAMILTLAMSVTVFAAPNADQNTFSLTLNKAVKGHTYEAYQILSGDLSADKATLSNIKWGEGITEAGQTALGGDAASYAEKLGGFGNNSSELKEQAQIIGANLASASGSVTVTDPDAKNVISNLKPGYYLIKDQDNSLQGQESYTEFILHITDDVVAILITRPDLATGKDILNSLEYYHFRTGHSINFYLPGYGAYWTEEEYPDGKVVTEIAGVKWSFSNQRFVEFIEDMEKYSKWRYSGESDLIFAEVKNGILSYERAIEFHLDNMLRDEAIISVNQFFEKIVRIGQEGRSMNQIGNKLGIDKGKQVVFDALLEKMPMHMGDVIKQEKYFCVKNIQN